MSRLFLAVLLAGLVLPAAAESPVEPAAVRPDISYYFEDFEASNGGYVSVGNHPWTWGPPPPDLAPPHSGVNVWATESPYHANAVYELRSPWIDLTGADPTHDLVLDWWQKVDIEPIYEIGRVEVSTDGSNWQPVWFGSKRDVWENAVTNFSAYIGQTVMLRFRMTSDYGIAYAGWAIDDVSIHSGSRAFPDIVVDAPPLDVKLCPDQQQALEMQICNTGVGTLNWSLAELEAGGAVSIPRFTGQIPPDANPPSPDRAPGERAPSEAAPVPAASSVLGGRAYAFELFSAQLYEIPDLDAPGVWNLVGSVIPYPEAADFAGNDYSQVYVIQCIDWQLWTVNTTTGAATLIGPSVPAATFWEGMSWDATTDTMYASTSYGGPAKLYTVNLATGEATFVANIANTSHIVDIAVDSAGQMYGHDVVMDVLLRIDKVTGATTVIGPTGFDASYWGQGMDFDDTTGTLYLAAYSDATGAELRIADVNTGATTLVGAFPEGEVDGLAIVGPAPDIAWLSEDPAGGSVLPGECVSVTVTFNSTGMAPGAYEAELLINNDDPHTPRISIPVQMTVLAPLSGVDLDWSPLEPIIDETVKFTATVAGGEEPLTYVWDFGDGITGAGITATHAYTAAGIYSATLTAGNVCGEVVVEYAITVGTGCEAPAVADFSWLPVAPFVGDTVTFTGTVEAGTPPFTFAWDFGDGATGTGITATHTYTAAGTFSVTLTVSNACDESVAEQSVTVVPVPPVKRYVYLPIIFKNNGGASK